jgi:hypothetical protein
MLAMHEHAGPRASGRRCAPAKVEDVEHALMVAHKDGAARVRNVLLALDLEGDAECAAAERVE